MSRFPSIGLVLLSTVLMLSGYIVICKIKLSKHAFIQTKTYKW